MTSTSVLSALPIIVASALSCARSYQEPNAPSLVVPGAAVAAAGALDRAAGCWRFRFPARTAPFLPDSALLYLDTARVRGHPPNAAYVARVVAVAPANQSVGAEWAPFGPRDSVYILLGTPSYGVRMRLGRAGDSLAGVGRTWDDTFTHVRSAPIAGERSSCATQPPQN